MGETFFEIKNISKSFPGVKALDNVSLSIEKGEVRALAGENGAGKSTLMKILNGNYKKDSGQILIDGKEVNVTSPTVAEEAGISIIFQELNLVEGLSIAENIFANRLSTTGKLIDWKSIYKKTEGVLKEIGFDANPRTHVSELSIAGKQMVEIAKALTYNSRILLMDEPSATLTQSEVDKMFRIIRGLKKKGVAIIYISHRIEEAFEICDSISVMRDGQIIGTSRMEDITKEQIVEMMVGRKIENSYPERSHKIGEEVLRVENLQQRGVDKKVSFSLHSGEVLGIAGLVGAGRSETMRALFGVDFCENANVYIKGQKVQIKSPADALVHNMAFLTEDRKGEGLALEFSVMRNIGMTNIGSYLTHGFVDNKKEKNITEKYIKAINIKTPSMKQKVFNLSGGNQQKVVVAKWLNAEPDIFIMDEPTRGIDVGAKYEIYELINQIVEEGKAVILISSELPEVLGMSDRVLVMKDNEIKAELTGDEAKSSVEVMRHAL